MTLLIGGFCALMASGAPGGPGEFEYDFPNRAVVRRSDHTLFDITYCEKDSVVKKLPEGAQEDVWYPIYATGKIDLKARTGDEVIKNHPFSTSISELRYVLFEGRKNEHAHFHAPYKSGGFKSVTRYKCYECHSFEIITQLQERTSSSGEPTVLEEVVSGVRYARQEGVSIQDFTNPQDQDYKSGKITASPDGVGNLNKQRFENTLKRWADQIHKI